jgi:hypothetical protein
MVLSWKPGSCNQESCDWLMCCICDAFVLIASEESRLLFWWDFFSELPSWRFDVSRFFLWQLFCWQYFLFLTLMYWKVVCVTGFMWWSTVFYISLSCYALYHPHFSINEKNFHRPLQMRYKSHMPPPKFHNGIHKSQQYF